MRIKNTIKYYIFLINFFYNPASDPITVTMGVTGGAAAVKDVHGPKVSLKEEASRLWIRLIGYST